MGTFLALHQIFTFREFHQTLGAGSPRSTANALLTYYIKRGRIVRLRQGLFYSIPLGSQGSSYPVDPFLVASKLTDDAVLAYHTALDYHGKLHTLRNDRVYLTRHKVAKPFVFQGIRYHHVNVPKKLLDSKIPDFGIATIDRLGIKIRVTTLERTFVDVLHRPTLIGSWEEIWRSLESIEYFDLKQVFSYLGLLNHATTCARVAFFLEMHREELHVSEEFLKMLEPQIPKGIHYLDEKYKGSQQFIPRWNLMVPRFIIQKTWEEPHGDF